MRLKNIFPWIFAFIGYIAGGIKVAFLGWAFGYLIKITFYKEENDGIGNGFNNNKISAYGKLLMLLAAEVMRADGKLKKSELAYIKCFLLKQMGSEKAKVHLQFLKHYLDNPGDLEGACLELRSLYSYSALLQLLHFLLGIAFADNIFSAEESEVAKTIAQKLGIRQNDYNAILAIHFQRQNAKQSGNGNYYYNRRGGSGYDNSYKSYKRNEQATKNDYAILRVSESASWDEIKRAYRKLAIQYHPDKVAHLGEEYQQAAKEKFQAIQSAYERIKKVKGK
jgi:DnaJ like chaperone protein